MSRLLFSLFLLMFYAISIHAGDFTLAEKNGSLSVMFKGKELISSSSFFVDDQPLFRPGDLVTEKQTLKDGSTVFNIISKSPARRFRQEGVISADGSKVELNMQFDCQAYSEFSGKTVTYTLALPFARFANLPFESINGRNMRPVNQKGVISPALRGNLTDSKSRMLTVKMPEGDLLFDFSPAGVCNYSGETGNTCIGMWQIARFDHQKDQLCFNANRTVPMWGGGIASKLIITRGDSKVYRSRHPRVKYSYYDALPAQRLYSFGAEKVGKRYTRLDLQSAGKSAFWVNKSDAGKLTGKHPGAFYSMVAGSKNALLKVKDLQPGYYFITAGIGNFEGRKNNFSIKVNGTLLAENIVVKPQVAASITRVFKLEKGIADIEFAGDWQISTLGFQLLTNFYEDFSFRRGFWVTDHFEPAVMYNNAHYAAEPAFKTGRTDIKMADPAIKAAPLKSLVYTTKQPSPEAQKSMNWRYTARVTQLGPSNNGTFQEFNAPGLAERRVEEIARQDFNVLIVSGLLSRHTYPAHLQRTRTMLERITKAAHARKIKVYDHIDYTLLWNMDSGFRVASENPAWLSRELDTLLPTTCFCVNNKERNREFRKFMKDYISYTKIDGMMIDEACFSGINFCGCGDCRSDFTRDTAQLWPINETAPDNLDSRDIQINTPLAKTFRAWRRKIVGDWWVELRNYLDKDFPQFGFLCYSTHYGLTSNYATNSLGSDLTQIARAVDFIGTEIMPRNVWANYRPVFAYRKAQNMLRNAFGIPIYGQIYAPGGWDVAYFGWGLMNMNSQVYWAEPPMKCPQGKGNYYEFSDRNMDIGKAESCADVALLFSSQGRDNGLMMNYKTELFGMAQTLGDMHVNYDMLCDTMLTAEALKKYKVLFVGTSAPLSDKQILMIREFAANGGHVILGAIAAIADEYGNMRAKWPFEDIFKFIPGNRPSKVNTIALDNGKVIKPAATVTAYLPQPRNMKMPESPLYMVWGKTRISAVFSKEYGKGKIKFMPIVLGANLRQDELMVQKKFDYVHDLNSAMACQYLWKNILDDAKAGTWQCSAPEKVLATLYRENGCYYAHFLNATGVNLKKGEEIKFTVPADAFPAPKENIVFTLPDTSVKAAEAASPDFDGWKKLELVKKDGKTIIVLPKELLKVYTLVRVK